LKYEQTAFCPDLAPSYSLDSEKNHECALRNILSPYYQHYRQLINLDL